MKNRLIAIAALLSLIACGKANDKREPVPASDTIRIAFENAKIRLLDGFIENGWVVSRHPDTGASDRRGEGSLWTNGLLGVLSCDEAEPFVDNLVSMIERRDGQYVRIEPLNEYESKRGNNFDSETGLYQGFVNMWIDCPSLRDRIKKAWILHLDYLTRNKGELYPDSGITMFSPFLFVQDALSHEMGLRGKPHSDRLRTLESSINTWALATKLSKKSCYRVNLGFLHMQMAEKMGYKISQGARDGFCDVTDGLKIPTVDHWCGRDGLESYVADFKFNEWEYRHQRCGAWETPDGAGLETPGLDYLVAIKQAYLLD